MKSTSPRGTAQTRWSSRFFIAAAALAGLIVFELLIGETGGKFAHRRITNYADHTFRLILPFGLLLIGFAFRLYEKGRERQ